MQCFSNAGTADSRNRRDSEIWQNAEPFASESQIHLVSRRKIAAICICRACGTDVQFHPLLEVLF